MNVSNTWKEFIALFNKKFGQKEIPFNEIEEVKQIQPAERELSSFNKTLKKIATTPLSKE